MEIRKQVTVTYANVEGHIYKRMQNILKIVFDENGSEITMIK
jgi:hypothetical protein